MTRADSHITLTHITLVALTLIHITLILASEGEPFLAVLVTI